MYFSLFLFFLCQVDACVALGGSSVTPRCRSFDPSSSGGAVPLSPTRPSPPPSPFLRAVLSPVLSRLMSGALSFAPRGEASVSRIRFQLDGAVHCRCLACIRTACLIPARTGMAEDCQDDHVSVMSQREPGAEIVPWIYIPTRMSSACSLPCLITLSLSRPETLSYRNKLCRQNVLWHDRTL